MYDFDLNKYDLNKYFTVQMVAYTMVQVSSEQGKSVI